MPIAKYFSHIVYIVTWQCRSICLLFPLFYLSGWQNSSICFPLPSEVCLLLASHPSQKPGASLFAYLFFADVSRQSSSLIISSLNHYSSLLKISLNTRICPSGCYQRRCHFKSISFKNTHLQLLLFYV